MSQHTNDAYMSRRNLLQLTGAATMSGALTSLSGCLGEDDDDENGSGGDPGEPIPEVHFVTWTQGGSPDVYEASRFMSEQFEELGLEINLDPQQFPQPLIGTLFDERDFDISMIGYVGEPARLDPSFFVRDSLHSDQIEDGGWNFPAYDNPDFDELSDAQQRTLDTDERQELVYELQQIAYDDAAWTIYASPDMTIGINSNELERPAEGPPGAGLLGIDPLTTISGTGDNDMLTLTYTRDEIGTLNPLRIDEAEVNQFIRPIYDTLVTVDPEGRPEPWILENLTIEDNTTVVGTLMDDITFHDGESLTSDDVVFSYEFLAEHEAPYFAPEIDPIETVEAEDDSTVRFDLAEPYAPFELLTLSRVPIIPEHIWATLAEDEGLDSPREHLNEPAIGSGPFEFSRHDDGSLLEYVANEDHPHAPEIETVRVRLYGNESSATQAVIGGDANGIWDVSGPLHDELDGHDHIDFYSTPNHRVVTLSHNSRRGMPFSDPDFRRAIEYAIPNEDIVNQVYNGRASPGGSVISDANEFWHNGEIEARPHDLDQARSILEDAGYSWDDNDRLLLPE